MAKRSIRDSVQVGEGVQGYMIVAIIVLAAYLTCVSIMAGYIMKEIKGKKK